MLYVAAVNTKMLDRLIILHNKNISHVHVHSLHVINRKILVVELKKEGKLF